MSSPSSPTGARKPRVPLAPRIAGAFLGLVALGGAIVLGWPQLLGLQRTIGIAQAVSFRLPVVIGAAVLLLLLLIPVLASRRARAVFGAAALVVAVFVVGSGVLLVSRGFGPALGGASGPEGAAANGDLRVLSWNTRGDEPGSPAVVDLALEADASIIVLPETTEEFGVEIASAMREAGRPMWVHTETFEEDYKATSTTLLIAADLGDYVVVTDRGNTSTLPSVIAVPLGDGPTIIAAHPVAPTPANMAEWESDLEWLAEQCTGNTIMAGDFNATLDHLSGLGADREDGFPTAVGECADGALATGNAALGTWSTGVPAPLATDIDHIMATDDWTFTAFEVVTDRDRAGSDHRPIVAELSPAS